MLSTLCKAAGWIGFHCHHKESASTPMTLHAKFAQHIAEYGLMFATPEEYQFRFELFENTDAQIQEMNKEGSFVTAHNMFSTMTEDEKTKMFGREASAFGGAAKEPTVLPTDILAADVDWRTKGAVNPVQNQGQCGSCWAFSSTAAIEGAHQIKTGNLLKLSEQQFVDCDSQSSGCNGGLEIWAFAYAEKNAIELETAYPYTAKDGSCAASSSAGQVSVTDFATVPPKDVAQLKAAINIQPTCVSVHAGAAFQQYSSGILDTRLCIGALNHAVTAVGYGEDNGKGYFIIRNSWGASWGESGYIRVSSDVSGGGVCGILKDSSRPTTN